MRVPIGIALILTFIYYALLFGIPIFDTNKFFSDIFYFILAMPELLISWKIMGCGFFFSGGCSNHISNILFNIILFCNIFLFFLVTIKVIFLIIYLIIKLILLIKMEYTRISMIPSPIPQERNISSANSD